jgi:hypothetical protein
MFALELRFGARPGAGRDEQVEAIGSYLAALVRNGNLLRHWPIAAEDRGWSVYAAAPARGTVPVYSGEVSGLKPTSQLATKCLRSLAKPRRKERSNQAEP